MRYPEMFRRLTIRHKLVLVAVGAQLALVALGLTALVSTRQLERATARVAADVDLVRDSVLVDMSHDAVRGVVLEAMLAGGSSGSLGPDLVTTADDEIELLLSRLAAVRAGSGSVEVVDAVDAVQPQVDAYADAARAAIAASGTGGAERALADFQAVFDQLEVSLPTLADAVAGVAATEKAAASRAVERAMALGVAVLVGTALVLGLVVWALARSIVRPIRSLRDQLRDIADGDGDLTRRADESVAGEIGELAVAFNHFTAKVADAIREIDGRATDLAAASRQLSTLSRSMSDQALDTAREASAMSHQADEVSAAVDEVSSSSQELAVSIREIASSASQAARVATEAVEVSDVTRAAVDRLSTSSLEIAEVAQTIGLIAEQTNLLALNATIEAARAGEAGKGFAIVANAVKGLASETANATADITTRLEAVQRDTGSAVEAINRITEIVGQICDTQSAIAAAVEEQTATTATIGLSVGHSAELTGQIARNAATVNTAAGHTNAGAGEAQDAATELARMAADLRRLVGQFTY